jgi:hypothetical protein
MATKPLTVLPLLLHQGSQLTTCHDILLFTSAPAVKEPPPPQAPGSASWQEVAAGWQVMVLPVIGR